MKNHLILHGHFYQPPREEPWSGLIPYQESAYPYHDWNKRITKECYAANAFSRVLGEFGNIKKIVNNYEHISYNFGPTLLNWIQDNAPNIYTRIIEADKTSISKYNGHGNAVAQAYNHSILPLDTEDNAKTQIIWGIKDFIQHFGRMPEGMWLGETAINERIIDILIDEGIQYSILSPWQAAAVAQEEGAEFKILHDRPIDSHKAYKIIRPHGTLSLFFYNQVLAQGISFEHYLRNAEDLYSKINSFSKAGKAGHLINSATDGEIYGHHEAFGDMCLASLSELVQNSTHLQFSNYGYYLEQFPAKSVVQLRKGEADLGSSWSCHHGVSRWYKDCGCSTGSRHGWNQEWRTPLRKAFEKLGQGLRQIYYDEIPKLSTIAPDVLRNMYIDVLSEKISRKEFENTALNSNKTEIDAVKRLYKLLEGQKFSMFSFTSCGWFFAELSGIEPVQNIKYALKAIALYKDMDSKNSILESFLSQLEAAKSNVSSKTGRTIAEELLPYSRIDLSPPACVFIFHYFFKKHTPLNKFGNYRLESITHKDTHDKNNMEGEITLEDESIAYSRTYAYRLSTDDINGFHIEMKEKNSTDTFVEIPLESMPFEIKTEIANALMNSVQRHCDVDLDKVYSELLKVLRYCIRFQIRINEGLQEMSKLVFNKKLVDLLSPLEKELSNTEIETYSRILGMAHALHIDLAFEKIRNLVSAKLGYSLDAMQIHKNRKKTEYFLALLESSRKGHVEPDMAISQNLVYSYLLENEKELLKKLKSEDSAAFMEIRNLIKLASYMGIDVDALKNKAIFS